MPLIEKVGSLFDLELPSLGHGCNTMGVMGAGVALQFRERYPDMYEAYKELAIRGYAFPGYTFSWTAEDGTLIHNMMTQVRPGADARYDYIATALRKAIQTSLAGNITQMGIPQIGAGIGGLDWNIVQAVIENVLLDYPDFELVVAVLK